MSANVSFISFSVVVIFIIRLFSTSTCRVPKLIGDNFGNGSKVLLRKVELAQRKDVPHQAAVGFLAKCIMYNFSPMFSQYKLCRSAVTYRKPAASILFTGFC